MAATTDEGMESLLSCFDQIYQDARIGIKQIQSLLSDCTAEIKKREALQLTVNSLKSENERLTKLCTESLTKLAERLECRRNCQALIDELERARIEHLKNKQENRNAMELLQQAHSEKVKDLETQMNKFQIQKTADEATINQLHQDLALHKTHIECLRSQLDQIHFDIDSRYHHEIQDLKDCLLVEQEEKNELNKKLQSLEKDLLMNRTRLAEQQRDLTSNRQVDTLKQKIMKLRKENEVLKRQLQCIKEG